MEIPIHNSTEPPTKEMKMKTSSRTSRGARPAIRARISTSSRMPWPKIIKGPADAPRRLLSVTVTVNNGPGIRAPERAIINDVQNIVINENSMAETIMVCLVIHNSRSVIRDGLVKTPIYFVVGFERRSAVPHVLPNRRSKHYASYIKVFSEPISGQSMTFYESIIRRIIRL